MLTRDQVRLSRTALHWTIKDLAKHAGITPQTVTKFENGGNITVATLEKMQAAIERTGITLIPANGGPATIRPPHRPAAEPSKSEPRRKAARR